MKVKRYVGQTTQEAIGRVRSDLGKDAIILNTRKIRRKGLIGWFSKPLVEVVAAIDEVICTKDSDNKKSRRGIENSNEVAGHSTKDERQSLETIESKVEEMGAMIQQLMSEVRNDNNANPKIPAGYMPYYDKLIENEVNQEFAGRLISAAADLHKERGIGFAKCLEQVILGCLGQPEPINVLEGKKKTVMFLGPTGVGKTTTLAKLAALFSIQQKCKVGLITADTYRIAAVDQLKVYAEILGIPLSIVYSPKEVVGAIHMHGDKDVILIDTAGRSLRDSEQGKELKELISFSGSQEIYLVISANTSYQGCVNIINSYKSIPDYKLLFTKMDEAVTYGIILNCCLLAGKPLSYITTGQNVPDDIEVANPEKLSKLLVGSVQI